MQQIKVFGWVIAVVLLILGLGYLAASHATDNDFCAVVFGLAAIICFIAGCVCLIKEHVVIGWICKPDEDPADTEL